MKRRAAIAIPIVLALALAGCAGDDAGQTVVETESADTSATQPASDNDGENGSTVPASGEPAPQGSAPESATFVWAVEAVPENLDVAKHAGDQSRYPGFERNGTLFMYDTAELDENGCASLAGVDQLRGELAESWERSDDGTTWTITLREAVSPYGNTVTADDVKWTFDRNIALSGIARLLYFGVAALAEDPITVIDERTFELNVAEPSAMDLVVLTHYVLAILDSQEILKHATDEDPWGEEWLTTNTAEFGPFYITEDNFQVGSEIVLTANPNYWGERGNIDEIILRAVPDAGARMQLLEAGEVDLANRLTYAQYRRLEGNDSVNVRQCVASAHDYLALLADHPAFSDPLVRQAISLGIDREEIREVAYQGYNEVSVGGIHRNFLPDDHDPGNHQYDPERARALLAEAGYPDGIDAVLAISPTRPGPEVDQTAVLLVNQLSQIGVRFQIKVIPGAEFTERTREFREEAWIGGGIPAIADVFYNTNISHTCESSLNTVGYCNPVLDELNLQLRDTDPGPERDALATEMADLLNEDLPVIELIDKTVLLAMADTIDPQSQHFAPTQGLYVYTMTKLD